MARKRELAKLKALSDRMTADTRVRILDAREELRILLDGLDSKREVRVCAQLATAVWGRRVIGVVWPTRCRLPCLTPRISRGVVR